MKSVLFCGPSGSGKTTIVHHLLKQIPALTFSVSATTREKRSYETDGKDYHFLTVEDFNKKISENAFLEWEEVYQGGFYGTLKSEIDRAASLNKALVFDVDVEGGLNLKKQLGKNLLACFVMPPSVNELRKRLQKRNTESAESLAKRLEKAEKEMTYKNQFDAVIINSEIETACEDAKKLVTDFIAQPV
jgi:guanylate kinase